MYQIGGSLSQENATYVEREADHELYNCLVQGELCFVFNARQMGKSSLRVRIQHRLNQAGYRCACIDMAGIGSGGVTEESWYRGIMVDIARGFGFFNTAELREFWNMHASLSSVQQLKIFIEDVLLNKFIDDQIFIFVDEVDVATSLDFSTDDFFNVIRSCYNSRVKTSAFNRLNWALVGVSSPAELIRDRRRSPFNIGRAIALRGFRIDEIFPLSAQLCDRFSNSRAILLAILHWTNGQPFLTQKLCRLALQVYDNSQHAIQLREGEENLFIKQIVSSRIITNWESQDHPEHLRTIRDRLLRDPQKAGRLLGLYRNLLSQENSKAVLADGSEDNTELLLSGLISLQGGQLEVSNLIYATVFDLAWVDAQLGALRPYTLSLQRWQASDYSDSSRLLRGQALEESHAWAKDKALSDVDYRFLSASEALARQEERQAFEAKQLEEVKTRLLEEQKNTRLKRAIVSILSGSLFLTLIAGTTIFFLYRRAVQQEQLAREGEVQAISNASATLLASHRNLDSLIEGIRAQKQLQRIYMPEQSIERLANRVLQQATYRLDEFNRLYGHSQGVRKIVFIPQGNRLASASYDQSLKVWSINGKLLETAKGHTGIIHNIDLSPDGHLLASASGDHSIRLWDMSEKKIRTISKLQDHQDRVWDVKFSSDGQWLASASQDSTIKIWNIKGQLIKTIAYPDQGWANSLSISPDDDLLATSSWDETVQIWHPDGSWVRTINVGSRVNRVLFSPDGQILATAGDDHSVKLWSLDGQLKVHLKGHQAEVWALAFSPDGKHIATGSDDKSIKIWTIEGTLQKTLRGHGNWVNGLTFSPDGKILASGSQDETIRLWKLDNSLLPQFVGHSEGVTAVEVLPGSDKVASVSDDRTIKVWQRDGKLLQTFFEGHDQNIVDLAVAKNEQLIATAGWDGTARLWHLEKGYVQEFKNELSQNSHIEGVAISSDSRTIATSQDNYKIQLWNTGGEALKLLEGHTGSVTDIAFGPRGRQLLSGAEDRSLRRWSVQAGKLEQTFLAHDNAVTALALSPQGNQVATGSKDGTVKLWARDIQGRINEIPSQTLSFEGEEVTSVAFSPQGDRIAAGSAANVINLWTVEGELLTSLFGHRGQVEGVTFSEDGQTLFSASKDKTIIRWNLNKVLNLDELDYSCSLIANYLKYSAAVAESDRELCNPLKN